MSSSSSTSVRRPRLQPEPVRRAAVVTHGRPETLGDALERVQASAEAAGVELAPVESEDAELVVALGGDGTMLRALRATLASPTPVFGVRFGRVGFLTSAEADALEPALARVFAGEFQVVELTTLEARFEQETHAAVNDVVITSAEPGRMVELGWEIAGEHLGDQPCDGMICCTPTGSTAYNLSNGGPVMVWGLEAMAMTFVAPHSLNARPIVVPRGLDLTVTNRTSSRHVTVLVDGHACGELGGEAALEVRVGEATARLALLPEVTFFSRYHAVFP
jgi:NAD+ kinase